MDPCFRRDDSTKQNYGGSNLPTARFLLPSCCNYNTISRLRCVYVSVLITVVIEFYKGQVVKVYLEIRSQGR